MKINIKVITVISRRGGLLRPLRPLMYATGSTIKTGNDYKIKII